MSIAAPAIVQCAVHLTHAHYYPGDAVEGAVVLDAATAFDVFNVHIKAVGKESINTMVDQVEQAKTAKVQFGISSQDCVYYRDIVTVAGALLTRPHARNKRRSSKLHVEREEETENRGSNTGACDGGDEEMASRSPGNDNADDDDDAHTLGYNESLCIRPDMVQQNRSFAVSQIAAAEGVSVRFPAGHYVYPFRFLLPSSLPPSYDTGICVKDGQHSNSQAALRYYVKVYVWSPARADLGSARADFVVGAMQPDYGSRRVSSSVSQGKRGADRASLTTANVPQNREAQCSFPVLGTCSCTATDVKLRATLTLTSESLQIGRDAIEVTCAIRSNTSRKPLRGLKVTLVQELTFETVEARVSLRKTVLEVQTSQAVQPGASATMVARTSTLESRADFMPTMKTSGFEVRYAVRVDLLASHIEQAYYVFEHVRLSGAVLAGTVPPVGPMRFTALPRGQLTKREAFYAIPVNPAEPPLLAALDAPLSVQGSRSVSRRASYLVLGAAATANASTR